MMRSQARRGTTFKRSNRVKKDIFFYFGKITIVSVIWSLVVGAYLKFVIWDLEFGRNAIVGFALRALAILLILVLLPGSALAQGLIEGISGSLESTYSFFNSKTTDASGNSIKTSTQTIDDRFQLDINTKIFPNLRLRAGGIAEGTWSVFDDKTNDIVTRTTVLDFRPYIDLTLQTPLYTASLGYDRRQNRVEVFGSPPVTLISDEYYGILGWRPEGLPSIDAQIRRRNLYDSDKDFQDIKEDFISLNPKYQYQGLRLEYYGTYLHRRDDLIALDVEQYTHSGRASYANSFFNNRVSLSTNYNILNQETKTKSEGKGFVTTQAFAGAGLSPVIPTNTLTPITLDPNPNLIDGNTTVSAGIDLVSNVPLVKGQIGLDFLNPTEVNQLFVYVDREVQSTVASSFSWELLTSDDNLTWVAKPITSVKFEAFVNRFEINFSSGSSRYIKVVTTPLFRSPLIPPDIFVTELQAFLQTPAADAKGTISTTTHTYDLDVKTRILDIPSLLYEVYYFFNRQEPSGRQRYDLINSLSANHRFNEVFSGKARVGIENGKELDDKRLAYIYNATVIADPLRTLHHSLAFNGREEKIGGRPNNSNSIILYNTARLYPGYDINLNGGVTFTKQENGQRGTDFLINFQTNIVPHRTMNLGLNYSDIISQRTGGDLGSSSNYIQTLNVNLSYNPFRTLNLFAFLQFISEKEQKNRILQNYAINWSPFPDGALQFNIAYNENYRTEDHLVERIFQPSMRYNLSKRSYVELSYQFIRSRSDIQKIDSNLLSTTVKIFF